MASFPFPRNPENFAENLEEIEPVFCSLELPEVGGAWGCVLLLPMLGEGLEVGGTGLAGGAAL